MLDLGQDHTTGTGTPVAPPGRSRRFAVATAGAVVVGAVVRVAYLARFPSTGLVPVGGDGFAYSIEAGHLADGLGYVDAFATGNQNAHHPPGWVTVLGLVARLGFRSPVAQQRVGVAIGLILIVVVAMVARRVFGDATGIVAAFVAAAYPGFWVVEAQILSEPLGLVTLGLVIVSLYRFAERPGVRRAVELGAIGGLAALVRSEQIAVLVLVLPVLLLRAPLPNGRRLALGGTCLAVLVAILAPWAIHNATRFDAPVLLSTNLGTTLLAGNCGTFDGDLHGFYSIGCSRSLAAANPEADRSVIDGLAREQALRNMSDHLGHLPATVVARHGRALGLWSPGRTVERVAAWHGTQTWPVWIWVVSFWPVLVLAVVGSVAARRRGVAVLPLVAPIVVVAAVISAFYGEPRYHTPADLSFVVLAAFGIVTLGRRLRSGTAG